jgi:hypothetical protein
MKSNNFILRDFDWTEIDQPFKVTNANKRERTIEVFIKQMLQIHKS